MKDRSRSAAPVDGSFLTGRELSDAIRHVLGGAKRDCAVAFWGKGSHELVDDEMETRGLRVVCDISMGGCNPEALRALGAPHNAEIRYHDGLHAKVFLSDLGVVVGSSNASTNGIGFASDDASLLEAGTFHASLSHAWKGAVDWFEGLHSNAPLVNEAALERARRLFQPRRASRAQPAVRVGSLIDLIIAEPDRFDGVGFVLCSASASADERAAARKAAVKAGIDTKVVESTSDNGIFVGWRKKDVLRWPVTFIELWMPAKRLYFYPRTIKAVDPVAGNVFTKKDHRALRRLVSGELPNFSEAGIHDAAIVAALLDDEGKVFRTASEFAREIEATIP